MQISVTQICKLGPLPERQLLAVDQDEFGHNLLEAIHEQYPGGSGILILSNKWLSVRYRTYCISEFGGWGLDDLGWETAFC